MKLKYYLRGLGIGIILTVIIMILAFRIHGSEMSDAQIIERAQQLGMQMPESGTLLDTQTEGDNSGSDIDAGGQTQTDDVQPDTQTAEEPSEPEDENTTDESTEPIVDEAANVDEGSDESSEPTDTTSNDDAEAPNSEVTEYVSFTISSGEFSDTVAANLQSANIISDASAFNRYLESSGYANMLQTGTYSIPVGVGDEELAKILCKRQ